MVNYYEQEHQIKSDLNTISKLLVGIGFVVFFRQAIFNLGMWLIESLQSIIQTAIEYPVSFISLVGFLIGIFILWYLSIKEDTDNFHGIDKRWILAGINSKKELVFGMNLKETFERAGEELVDSGAFWDIRMLSDDRSTSIWKHIFISKELLGANKEETDDVIESVLRHNNIIVTRGGATAHK